MSDFEAELRSALRREQPPPGFAGRVLVRTGVRSGPRRSSWIAAAIAACLVMTMSGFEYRQYRGRKAKQELLMALEIAGSKLNMAENKLNLAEKKISALNWRVIHD